MAASPAPKAHITLQAPGHPAVLAMLEEHLADMRVTSPPESTHALDAAGLADRSVQLWTAWMPKPESGEPQLAGCIALKRLSHRHAEIKFMRTKPHARGSGVGTQLLQHLIGYAQELGLDRLSLETGVQDYFASARTLYRRHGFVDCAPFGDYRLDANSVFMTLSPLAGRPGSMPTTPLRGGTGDADYAVYPQGAHLAHWRPASGGPPVIWESPLARHEPGVAIRGGVPICFPWFGPGFAPEHSPSHGFARISPWRLIEHTTGDQAAGEVSEAATFVWELSPADVAGVAGAGAFDYDFHAQLRQQVDQDKVRIDFTVTNNDHAAFEYEAALHTYLAVAEIRDVRIDGAEGASYWDKISSTRARQEGPIRLQGPTDRVYEVAGPLHISDDGYGRSLTIETPGADQVVVWNPWTTGAASMGDMPDDGWQHMVAIEAANVLDRRTRLAPGQHHRLSTIIRVDR